MTGARVDAAKRLAIAEQYLADRRAAFCDPILTGPITPTREERRQMAAAGGERLEKLNAIERQEGFARTDFSRGYKHISEIGPSGLSRGGAETSEVERTIGDSGADITALTPYVS